MTARTHRTGIRALRDTRGGAAVEFGILAPILALVFAGLIDLGSVLFVKFRIDSAVSAGASYALVQADNVDAAGAEQLAAAIASIVANATGDPVDATITVNNGTIATATGGKIALSGKAAGADSCYCPSVTEDGLAWGEAAKCGADCKGGGFAGKFVSIAASRHYAALFSNYGTIKADAVTAAALVQTK